MRLKIFLAVLLIVISAPAFAQVAPTATGEGSVPLSVGGGATMMDLDWGHSRRMEGPTVWIDWNLTHLSKRLGGLGIELEGHAIDYGKPASIPRMRQDSYGGGVIYTVQRYHSFRPYGKFLVGYGSIDFSNPNPNYKHDTRTIYMAGAGVEYHLVGNLWARGEYEYQFWPNLFQGPHTLDPQGVTIGATYKFGHRGLQY